MDFINERAEWMTKVLDDHDISRKATMFDQAQKCQTIAMWVQIYSFMALDRTYMVES